MLKSLASYLHPSTRRTLLRDLYYRLPLPPRARWAARNVYLRIARGTRGASWGKSQGPWTATLAASRRIAFDSEEVRALLRRPEDCEKLPFAAPERPAVSVVIPVFNKVEYTAACLLSILAHPPAVSFEVIVVDDASTDATAALLGRWPGLRHVRNAANLGFVGSCNHGASVARGAFVYFLNNDTNVLAGWLDELHRTFAEVPDAGVVGSKLVFPDGFLQESGGIIWRDGSGWNYGRDSRPDDCHTSYLREVDYVSGASLMVPLALFRDLGGFDTLYAPAYYEDTDLAFRVRARGLRVLVQPASIVIHYEGATSGRDLAQGMKRHQVVNREKFVARWQDTLRSHGANGEAPELSKERGVVKRALMLDVSAPEPDRDAGSVVADQHIRILQRLGYKVTFASEDMRFDPRYTARLQRRGVECLYHPYYVHLRRVLRRRGGEFDLLFVSRPYVAGPLLRDFRRHCPQAKLVYNTTDLHWVREGRQAELEGNFALAQRARRTKRTELRIIAAADATIVVSGLERSLVQRELPQARVEVISLILDEEAPGGPADSRSGMVFIGGWRHSPNGDALRHFVRDVLPLLRSAGWREPLFVVGERTAEELRELDAEGIELTGRVEDIGPWLRRARCMVVPLRYGAGVKGKIATAFSYGLPVVSTSIGVEGMDLVEERHYLRADSPQEWAGQLRRLAGDAALWERLAASGREVLRERYSPERATRQLESLLASLQAL